MSKFFSNRLSALKEYVPGEQPREMQYIKLNTNESPFPPSPEVKSALSCGRAANLQLYPEPDCIQLIDTLAKRYGVGRENIILSNGSDEILNFCFAAYFDKFSPVVFPDITYGFYKVFAQLYNSDFNEIPLDENLCINTNDYIGCNKNIVIANPNAPTGIALPVSEIEKIVASNPDNIIIIDEAYVDFGAESCVRLLDKYDNLIVIMTFSKSRSLAGARVGFAISNEPLINDLNKIKNSTNPYNLNSMSAAAALGSLNNDAYNQQNCEQIIQTREYFCEKLRRLGFEYLPSMANFVFAKRNGCEGRQLYSYLKSKGILVRHFDNDRIKDYLRITIGTRAQMDALLDALKDL